MPMRAATIGPPTPFPPTRRHSERHRTDRIPWLRAAVLGANDGILSTASLVAGAMSMAAGEYVSESSQADTEGADLARARKELAGDSAIEHKELAAIYVERRRSPSSA